MINAMQKRGGGRFGKYGDLKRKEKIRQAQRIQKGESLPGLHPEEPKTSRHARKPIDKK